MNNSKRDFLSETKRKFYDEIRLYSLKFNHKKELEGYPASSIVGEKNYPNIRVHSISNGDKNSTYKKTSLIVKNTYDEIVKLKAKNILGSTSNLNIKNKKEKIKEEISDIYKAKNDVNFASHFEKELNFDRVLTSKITGIMGSKNELISLHATENISIKKRIDKYTNEDIKSKEIIIDLYKRGYNEHQIINLLSLGEFGYEFRKKLVPTRWAISAYDKSIESYLHKKILDYKLINNYELYTYKDKGNFFLIILFPEYFCSEIIETFNNNIEKDFVQFDNKLRYKDPQTAGGFYATKLGIFENLNHRKKQSAFISIRIIDGYDIPLGVVFVRESVREAMKKKIFETSKLDILDKYIMDNFLEHYNHFKNSKVLVEINRQKRLDKWF
jgi:hypothetical protein